MISTSAVGYYSPDGCHGEHDDPAEGSFLAELCEAWEAEAERVNDHVRLVRTRFGVVLSPDGGALPKMIMPTRFGVTVSVGKPDHAFSWVALDDLVNALAFILEHGDVSGPVNVTAPNAPPMRSFTRPWRNISIPGRPSGFRMPPYGW